MINVKDQVYAKLCEVAENVTDVYPQDWIQMPAIQYTEEANNVYEKTDDAEQLSYLRYLIDIWDNRSTSQTAIAIDNAIAELGLVRIECRDVPDPSGRRHKQMRYEGIIANDDTQRVYWNANR